MEGFQCVFNSGLSWRWACMSLFSVILIFLNSGAETMAAAVTGMFTACGDPDLHARGTSGEIKSPNYPNAYPASTACKWHIMLADSQVAILSFVDFDIEENHNCYPGDVLEISPKGVSYCGSSLPPPYISEIGTHTVVVTFKSGSSNMNRGFQIDYVIVERHSSSCHEDTEFHCRVGNCIPMRWKCNGMHECSDGSDELRENCQPVSTVGYTTAPLKCPSHYFICRLTNTQKPACVPESLKCDGHVDCADREDEDGCKCEHVLKGSQGYFMSPNFPGNYDANLECYWYLTVSEGNIIQLRFDVFDLEQEFNTDFVTVYNGQDNSDEIGTYYGYIKDNKKSIYMPPAVIEGAGNKLKVLFHTDGSSSSKGFNATYQTKGECLENQKLCSNVDKNCFDANERCDNRMTCIKGEDELGCSDSCHDKIACFESPSDCFSMDERCNGKKDCMNGEDEKYCDISICSYGLGLFRCNDGTCMEERYTCDSSIDCLQGEDEENCSVSTNIVTAAAVGSIVCGLLLVAALSCTCKLYQLHVRERLPPSHMSPLREIEEELLRREAPPSYTATMASPHFDEAQRAFIEGIQAAVIARNESRSSGRHNSGSRRQRGTFVRMLSRDNDIRSISQQVQPDENTNESQTETLPPSPAEGIDNDLESAPQQEEISTDENGPPPLRRISGERSVPIIMPSSAEAHPHSAGPQQQESASSSVSDTDSETNQDALQLAARDQQILRAAANIRRMRLAGGLQNVMQAQDHRAARVRSRTGSLIASDSAPEEDSTEPMSDSNPESVAAVGSLIENTNNMSESTDTADQGLPAEAIQDVADETPASSQESPACQEAESDFDQLHSHTPQAEGRSSPSHENSLSPDRADICDDKENQMEEEEGNKDFNEERLSQASSMLSLASIGSVISGEDVPMLNP